MNLREMAKFMSKFAEDRQLRGGGGLAKVNDGYGGARPRRSYMKRRMMVHNGVVQKRILQFTGCGVKILGVGAFQYLVVNLGTVK